ncbi:unnamed protein product, partial [Scytosiphon promiscuus]
EGLPGRGLVFTRACGDTAESVEWSLLERGSSLHTYVDARPDRSYTSHGPDEARDGMSAIAAASSGEGAGSAGMTDDSDDGSGGGGGGGGDSGSNNNRNSNSSSICGSGSHGHLPQGAQRRRHHARPLPTPSESERSYPSVSASQTSGSLDIGVEDLQSLRVGAKRNADGTSWDESDGTFEDARDVDRLESIRSRDHSGGSNDSGSGSVGYTGDEDATRRGLLAEAAAIRRELL